MSLKLEFRFFFFGGIENKWIKEFSLFCFSFKNHDCVYGLLIIIIQILIFFSDKKLNGYSLLCVLLDGQISLETYIKVYEPNIRLSHCDIVCSCILASLKSFCCVLHVTCSFVTFFCNISHVMGLTTCNFNNVLQRAL